MNLTKSYDFFQPEKVDGRVHIIGCGSVGSTLAENLARCGITKMTLWDFDTVSAHNIHNQMFFEQDIGKPKVYALRDHLMMINPDIEKDLVLKPDGWNGEKLSGYIFLAMDSIEIRKQICETNMNNMNIHAVFDFRTELTGAQHYAADWMDYKQKQNLMSTMDFTHEEAVAEAPTSACGVTLGVVTTVRLICAIGVNNFIRFIKGEKPWKFCQVDGFRGFWDCF